MQAKLIGIQCYTAYLLWLTNKKKRSAQLSRF